MLFWRCSLFCLFITLMSCSTKKADVYFQHATLLKGLTSYSLFPRNSSFSEQQNISDGLRNSIEIAIEGNFEQQGFTYKEVSNADVIVTYQLLGKNYKSKSSEQPFSTHCEHCTKPQKKQAQRSRNQQAGRDARSLFEKQETEAITLRLLDSTSRRTLWHASYPLQITTDDYNLAVQDKVGVAIEALIQQLTLSQK